MNLATDYLTEKELFARNLEWDMRGSNLNRNQVVNLDFLEQIECEPESKLIGCGHIKSLYPQIDRAQVIRKAVKTLKKHKDSFEAIAVSGYSSSLIGSILADRLNKNLIVVRKDSEERISKYLVEGIPFQSYIYVDDLIETGRTLRRVYERCEEFLRAKLYGVYCFNEKLNMNFKPDSYTNPSVQYLGA